MQSSPNYNYYFGHLSSNIHVNNNENVSFFYDKKKIYPSETCDLGNLTSKIDHIYLNNIINNDQINITSFSDKNNNSNNININTNSTSQKSINLISSNGGVQLIAGIKGLQIRSPLVNITSKNLFIDSENIINLKSKNLTFNNNEFKLISNQDLKIKSNYGNISISSGEQGRYSLNLISLKGSIFLDSKNEDIHLKANKNIIIETQDKNSSICIGKNSKNTNTIVIGNDNSKVYVNSDLVVKGDIIINDNSIKNIGTYISETNESLILLGKNNFLGLKDLGIIGRNKDNFIGFLFDQNRNEFVLSEKLNFDYNTGLNNENKYLNLGNLLINNLNINNKIKLTSEGNISFNQIENNCSMIDNKGNINSDGNLAIRGDINFNDKFQFNSNTGNCEIEGILMINNININNLYKYHVGKNYKHTVINEIIQEIESHLEINNQIIYLSNQIYNEELVINFPLNIFGNKSEIFGNIHINIKKEIEIKDKIIIKDLNINVDNEYYSCLNTEIEPEHILELENISFGIYRPLTYIVEIDNPNGILILKNLQLDLNYNIQNLIIIKKLLKLEINNCYLNNSYDTETLTVLDEKCQIIIRNSYLEGNFVFKNNDSCILIGNIIKKNNREWYNNYKDIQHLNKIIL